MKALCEIEPGDQNLQDFKQFTVEVAKIQKKDPEAAWTQRKNSIRTPKQLIEFYLANKNYSSVAGLLRTNIGTCVEFIKLLPVLVAVPPVAEISDALKQIFPKLSTGDFKEPYVLLNMLLSHQAWKGNAVQVWLLALLFILWLGCVLTKSLLL